MQIKPKAFNHFYLLFFPNRNEKRNKPSSYSFTLFSRRHSLHFGNKVCVCLCVSIWVSNQQMKRSYQINIFHIMNSFLFWHCYCLHSAMSHSNCLNTFPVILSKLKRNCYFETFIFDVIFIESRKYVRCRWLWSQFF